VTFVNGYLAFAEPYALSILFFIAGISEIFVLICAVLFIFTARAAGVCRFAPLAVYLGMFLILSIIPETGWSDTRSQWHQNAAIAVYSIFYITMALWVRSLKNSFSSFFALIIFINGASFLCVTIALLSDSWYFYHVLLVQ
jgi:hypothetical protein